MTLPRKRIFFLGATGTIGRATVGVLIAQGHEVVCFLRHREAATNTALAGAELRFGDVLDPLSVQADGMRGERFDAVISTLASRTGVARDAWAIDYGAHAAVLKLAQDAAIRHFVLLSAICVQKPLLAFQKAKLAFEKELIDSGLVYSIVRPTAFFKSLSGQAHRAKVGKPYLVFGDGRLTACKPISDHDLGVYLADCLGYSERWNRILPIGGPGEAITPHQQGEMIFALLGQTPRFRSVPVGFLRLIRTVLAGLGHFSQSMADKAELASIGLFYATESMLVLDPKTGHYDAAATPSTGQETLLDYYRQLLNHDVPDDRGSHAVF